MKIELNNLVTSVFWFLAEAKRRYVVCYGGSGSSKSYSMQQLLILKTYKINYDILVIRKTGASIRNSVYKGFKERVKALNLSSHFEFRFSNDNRSIKNKLTGRLIIFTGLDDPEKIKSIENIQIIFVEEANQISKSDFLELNRRVRGKENIQFYLLFNPVSIHHWIKKHFFDNQKIKEKTNIIKITYKDNPYLTADDIKELEDLKYINENDYNIYALGEWGLPSTGLIWQYVSNFDSIETRQNKIYWSKYETLPDFDFYTLAALDFGGSGKTTDEPDGSSKTVLQKMYIHKETKTVYHKLILYRGFIDFAELLDVLEAEIGKRTEILADNARQDKILEIANRGFLIFGAKSKEGKSGSLLSGYDILKQYNHYYHVSDFACHVERENHSWVTNKMTGEFTGIPEDRYKDTTDTARYGLVYYHLNYNF
jgi:phage terminase large subunit